MQSVHFTFHNAYIFLTDKLYLPTKSWIVFAVFTNVNTHQSHNSKNNIPNLRYSIKTSASAMISVLVKLVCAEKDVFYFETKS